MKLYQIRIAYENALHAAIDVETGEIRDETLCTALDLIEGKLSEKALDVAAYVVNLEAEAMALEQRSTELRHRAKVTQNRAESLRHYLAGNLPAGTKLADDRVQIGWRESERCIVDRPDDLPIHWQRVKIEPDVAAIKAALAKGDAQAQEIAHLETRQNLVIR